MRIRIKYLLFFLLSLSALCSNAQCDLKYEIRVDKSLVSEGGAIILTLKEIKAPVQLKLYDIMEAGFSLILDRKVQPDAPIKTIEFPNLKSSTYSIMATWEGCSENIGGIKGIRIDKTRKK